MIRGYTMVEILITLAVVGILMGTAFPTVWQAHQSYKRYAATRRLQVDLQRARSVAVQRAETVRVVIDTIGGRYRGERSDGVVIFDRRLNGSLALRTTAYRQTIPFTARGTANLYSTTWIVTADGQTTGSVRVRVSPVGAITAH